MSVQIYPVTPVDIHCEDYTVKLNGKEVPLDTARVSAYPFNRRWPGHQRQVEQTELSPILRRRMFGSQTESKPTVSVADRPFI